MDVQHVSAFLVLAEELHFGKAARRLYISQPALSRIIKHLEHELGHALFERSTRQVLLTPVGKSFVSPARTFVHSHDRAVAQVAQARSGDSGLVSIGFAGASSHAIIGNLVHYAHEHFPGIMLDLYSSNFAETGLLKVQDGALDLALGRWESIPEEIDSHLWTEDHFVVALPTSHPKARRQSVRFDELHREQFIQFPDPPGSELNHRLTQLYENNAVQRRLTRTSPDTWTTLALVSAGIGVALTYATVKENVQFPGVIFVDLEDRLEPAYLNFAWQKSSNNPALPAIVKCIQEIS